MDIVSKGLRTDIVLDSLETSIENRPDYVVVRTQAVPDYHAGNKIIFANPPQTQQELDDCIEIYQANFDMTAQNFMHMTWDVSEEPVPLALLAENGFDVMECNTMEAQEVQPAASIDDRFSVDTIQWHKDLSAMISLHIDPDWKGVSVSYQRRFWQMKALKMQQFQEIFSGNRWVIKEGAKLVADLGLYAIKNMARFHAIMVDPAYRNQGLASSMIWHAARHAKQAWDVDELLLMAEKGSRAQALYTKLGFQPIETIVEATKMTGVIH